MTLKEGLLVAPTLLLLTAVTARAQETPRVGLTIGYPASVGVIWHISDRVAVRPDLAASWTSFKPSTSTGARDDGSSATIGLSGLFYLAKHDALQIYVTPRVGYLRTAATVQTTVSIFSPTGTLSPSTLTYNTTDSTYTTSGSFGAEYALGRHFGVFAEVGLAYTHSTSTSTSTPASAALTSILPPTASSGGTRSGIGAILYF